MTVLPDPPVFAGTPMAQITPFTYREGATLMYIIERLKRWSVELGPSVQAVLDEALKELTEYVDDAKTFWDTKFDEFIQNIIKELEGLNDQSVANLVNDVKSFTRIALDANFADKETQEIVKTGRLRNMSAIEGRVHSGIGATASLPLDYATKAVVAIGPNAMANAKRMKTGIAIGSRAMMMGETSRDNIAIGDDSLFNVRGVTPDYDQANPDGTRNVAIGGNAGRSVSTGRMNVIIGRNAGQNVASGVGATIIGAGANASVMPIGLTGDIENWAPIGGDPCGITAFGYAALSNNSANNVTAFGSGALLSNTASQRNTAIGMDTFRWLDDGSWVNGQPVEYMVKPGEYSQTGNDLTLEFTNHGAAVGDIILIRLLSGESQTLQGDRAPAVVTTVNGANVLSVKHPVARNTSGQAELRGVIKSGAAPSNNDNTALGDQAGRLLRKSNRSTFLGSAAGYWLKESDDNTVVGARALAGNLGSTVEPGVVRFNAVMGTLSLGKLSAGQYNTSLGCYALSNLNDGSENTAIGYSAGRYNLETVELKSVTGSTALGANSKVSGNNQVQLGSAATTPYAYNAVQLRSDVRDKREVEDTKLGLDFLKELRPVDYKLDYRDLYENGVSDGTHVGKRKHHGLIAQEVKAAADKLGVDFAGYQDHKVDGGADVLTLGYSELIAPMVKAIQELSGMVESLQAEVAELRGK